MERHRASNTVYSVGARWAGDWKRGGTGRMTARLRFAGSLTHIQIDRQTHSYILCGLYVCFFFLLFFLLLLLSIVHFDYGCLMTLHSHRDCRKYFHTSHFFPIFFSGCCPPLMNISPHTPASRYLAPFGLNQQLMSRVFFFLLLLF